MQLILAVQEAITPQETLKLMDQYGVAWAILAILLTFFIGAGAYAVYRLLHSKHGIITNYVQNATKQQERLTAAVEQTATADVRMTALLAKFDGQLDAVEETLERIEQLQVDPGAPHSNVALTRSFVHACDIFENIAEKLGMAEECNALIGVIRRELSEQARAVSVRRGRRKNRRRSKHVAVEHVPFGETEADTEINPES